jgi:hypothetical protein
LRNLLILPDGSTQLTRNDSFITTTLAIVDRDLLGGYILSESGRISRIIGINGFESPSLIQKLRAKVLTEVVRVRPVLELVRDCTDYAMFVDELLTVYGLLPAKMSSMSKRVSKHIGDSTNFKEFFDHIERFLTYY